jgi:hypothetical protein
MQLKHTNATVKLLVLQSPPALDSGRLQKVLAPDSEAELSLADEPLARGVKHAQDYAAAAMRSTLSKQPGIVVVSPPEDQKQFIASVRGRDWAAGLSQQEAERLRTTTGADALLRFMTTDYGLTPRSWRKGYITFEVTTTLGLAAIIAYSGSTVAQAAAGTYLIQEAAEETAEAYAGFWALDVVCRPVRIDAELIGLEPVTEAWRHSDTGLSDVRLSRLTGEVTPAERSSQLDQATDDAITDIVSALSGALKDNEPQRLRKR